MNNHSPIGSLYIGALVLLIASTWHVCHSKNGIVVNKKLLGVNTQDNNLLLINVQKRTLFIIFFLAHSLACSAQLSLTSGQGV